MDEVALLCANVKPFMTVLVRTSGVVGTTPMLGGGQVPRRITAALVVLVSLLLFPVVAHTVPAVGDSFWASFVMILRELGIGMTLGLTARAAFAAAQIAGEFVGLQMGFSVAGVADPLSGQQISLTSQFYTVFCTLIFVAVDGHHIFLMALARSYDVVPVMSFSLSTGLITCFCKTFIRFFALGIQLAAPLVACLVLVTVAIGVVAKMVPQINILQMGFALRIAVGIASMLVFLPIFNIQVRELFLLLRREVFRLLTYMG